MSMISSCYEPIYKLRNQLGRFGYADDTAILCFGDSGTHSRSNIRMRG
jgi:hypothetical protein